jgi:hypothetical protein
MKNGKLRAFAFSVAIAAIAISALLFTHTTDLSGVAMLLLTHVVTAMGSVWYVSQASVRSSDIS